MRHQLNHAYQSVHLARVVPDRKVALLQDLGQKSLARPFQIAVIDPALLTPQLRDQLRQELVGSQTSLSVQLLITAEGGLSWAVLHPRSTLIAPF